MLDKNDTSTVGNRVKILMKYLRISQTLVGEILGKTRQCVASRISGQSKFKQSELELLTVLFCLPSVECLTSEEEYKKVCNFKI